MKAIAVFLAAALGSTTSWAALQYRFQSVTSAGGKEQIVSGTAKVDGARMRLDIEHGDELLMTDGAVVVSANSGKMLLVANPAQKTYYELNLDDLMGGAGSLLGQLGGLVDISFSNQKVDAKDDGDGGVIEGFPTHKSTLTTTYDMNLSGMGQSMTTHVQLRSQTWATDKLPASAATFVQSAGAKTGIESVDKLIGAQGGTVKGFPLKQVTTTSMAVAGKNTDTTTTVTVSDIQKDARIVDTQFDLPAGYTKIPSPLEDLGNLAMKKK
jgi:hypothetical protein